MILSEKNTSSISRLVYILLCCFALTSCVDLSEQRDDGGATDAATGQPGEDGGAVSEQDETTPGAASVSSAEFEGKYEGVVPCEDCEGIETEIVINNNQTFRITSNYLGKNQKIEDNGRFEILADESIIHLRGKDTDLKLKVEDDKLYQLDTDDQVIEGDNAEHFIYNKK